MRDDHILDLLDGKSAYSLDEGERSRVEAHAASCGDCRLALAASRIAADLVATDEQGIAQPPPFFEKRVMAALRARGTGDAFGLAGLWRATWPLVSAMAMLVVVLAAIAYLAQAPDSRTGAETATGQILYSAEWDLIESSGPQPMTDDQVIAVLYAGEDTYGPGR